MSGATNDLDRVIHRFGSDEVTARDLCKGTIAIGASGSGKSSSIMAYSSLALFEAGYGGVICTTKPSDRDDIQELLRMSGRSADDVVIMDASAAYRLNILEYTRHHLVPQGASVAIEINLLLEVMHQMESKPSQSADAFWDIERAKGVMAAANLLIYGGAELSARLMLEVIQSMPRTPHDLTDDAFIARSLCMQYVLQAEEQFRDTHGEDAPYDTDLRSALAYFTDYVPLLEPRVRSNILATIHGFLFPATAGLMNLLLDDVATNMDFASCWEQQKIILIDIPAAVYGTQGLRVSGLLIYLFQKQVMQRDLKQNDHLIFCMIDEFQKIMGTYFAHFQGVCRSQRIMSVYATQSISSLLARVGGIDAKHEIDSLIGNLSNIFIFNGIEAHSLEYCASLIGRSYSYRLGFNVGAGKGVNSSSASEEYRYEITPIELRRLKSGGPANGCIVECIFLSAGKTFEGGSTWKRLSFDQRIE